VITQDARNVLICSTKKLKYVMKLLHDFIIYNVLENVIQYCSLRMLRVYQSSSTVLKM